MTLEQVRAFTAADVLSVYSGRDGRCCCGCSGKHTYNPAHREEAGKDRGYTIDDDEVSGRQVSRVLRIVQEAPGPQGDRYVARVVGDRLYVVYLRPSVAAAAQAQAAVLEEQARVREQERRERELAEEQARAAAQERAEAAFWGAVQAGRPVCLLDVEHDGGAR